MMIATHSSACFALTHLLVLLCAFFFFVSRNPRVFYLSESSRWMILTEPKLLMFYV